MAGEAGYLRLDKSFASTTRHGLRYFFCFFFSPLPRHWRAYAAVHHSTCLSLSLSLSIPSNTAPLENPAVLVCVFEKYFSLVRFDYGSRVIPRVASAITKIHRIRDAGGHRYEKNPAEERKGAGSEKLIKGIRVARRGGPIDDASLSFSPLDDGTFHGMITITNVAWLSKQTFIKARRIVARVARL